MLWLVLLLERLTTGHTHGGPTMKYLMITAILAPHTIGCASTEDACEETCTFIYGCGMDVDDCMDKCVTNTNHSDECAAIYDQAHECTQDNTCAKFEACIKVHTLDDRYKEAQCPR